MSNRVGIVIVLSTLVFAVPGCKKDEQAAPTPAGKKEVAAPAPPAPAAAPAAPAVAPVAAVSSGCDVAAYRKATPAVGTVLNFEDCTFREFKAGPKEAHFQSAVKEQNADGWAICGDVKEDPGLKEGDAIDVVATVMSDTPGLTACKLTKK